MNIKTDEDMDMKMRMYLVVILTTIFSEILLAQQLVFIPGCIRATAVSRNGLVVTGINYDYMAVRWTKATGTELLGNEDYSEIIPSGISGNGQIIVATCLGLHRVACRWTASNGWQRLGTLGGPESEGYAISADGLIVVGRAQLPDSSWHAFRWTEANGMVDLGMLPGYDGSAAYGISADGTVIVGKSGKEGVIVNSNEATRWVWEDGWVTQDLGNLGHTIPGSWANDVSDDGSTVVGAVGGRLHAFRWTESSGMEDLGVLDGFVESEALAVSADGSVIVGWMMDNDGNYHAFRWTESGGMEDLNVVYSSLLSPGEKLYIAYDISPDGRYIVGSGSRGGFWLDTGISTAVEEVAPVSGRLVSLWPNPFHKAAHVRFRMDMPGRARLVVYDLLGRSVRTLLEGPLAPGVHEVIWDGRSDAGVRLPAGLYLLRLEAGRKVQSRTITLLR